MQLNLISRKESLARKENVSIKCFVKESLQGLGHSLLVLALTLQHGSDIKCSPQSSCTVKLVSSCWAYL